MAASIELTAGATTSIGNECYLEAKLTGTSMEVRLEALSSGGLDVAEPRHLDSEVAIRPGTTEGSIRLVAVPTGAPEFEPGARCGLEVWAGAGAPPGGRHIVTTQTDAGGFRSLELARVTFHAPSGWTITAGGEASSSAFDFLMDAEPALPSVDEREYPWVRRGRYAVRRAQAGTHTKSSGQQWSFAVDSSASMRSLFDASTLASGLELIAGSLVELTGRLPTVVGLTGANKPVWVAEAVTEPGTLASLAFSTGPASWSLALPVLEESVRTGGEVVVMLMDGPPADLDALPRLLEEHPRVTLVFVVVETPAPELVGHARADLSISRWAFHQVERCPQIRVVPMSLGDEESRHSGVGKALALALTGVRP